MSDILTRLRSYNPPDRTEWTGRLISQDIHDAANEIDRLRARLAQLEEALRLVRAQEGCNCAEWAGRCDGCERAYQAADAALAEEGK